MKTPNPLITLVLTLLSFSLVLADDAVVMPQCGVCAHRGDKQYYPENTVPAFKSAVEKGAQMVEFDVKLTKDGIVLTEIAPGIDLEKDVLGQMEFKPIIADDLKEMDPRIFCAEKMGWEL